MLFQHRQLPVKLCTDGLGCVQDGDKSRGMHSGAVGGEDNHGCRDHMLLVQVRNRAENAVMLLDRLCQCVLVGEAGAVNSYRVEHRGASFLAMMD